MSTIVGTQKTDYQLFYQTNKSKIKAEKLTRYYVTRYEIPETFIEEFKNNKPFYLHLFDLAPELKHYIIKKILSSQSH